jgi:type VI secretion system secreted protein VgrG
MKSDLEQLQRDGWTVVWGPSGGGYHSDRATKTIYLDPATGTSDQNTITMLSHEMGHAKYTLPDVSPAGLTRQQYIQAKVQSQLEDEGEATLSQIAYKDCLKKGGGPDVLLWYAKSAEYQQIAKKYPDPKDRAKARTEVANMYGDNEHPSNCPGQTYRQYYEKPCCAPACGTGTRGWAESLTDDQWKALGGKI